MQVEWWLVDEPDERTCQAILWVENNMVKNPDPDSVGWATPMDGPIDPEVG